MDRNRRLALAFVFLFLVFAAFAVNAHAIPPLEGLTLPPGTLVIPMDDKQSDRIVVYGFVHAITRAAAELLRVIEPPDVTLFTELHPSGASYKGGPILVEQRFASVVDSLRAKPDFSGMIVTKLTQPFISNTIFRVTKPTSILIIKGIWGRTDEVLDRMKIPYKLVELEDVERDPAIIFSYSLVVVDCPGWYGQIPQSVKNNLRKQVSDGNEVVFTDIAYRDLNATFPGFVSIKPYEYPQTVDVRIYNPPKGFAQAEFPSQYFGTGPDPNKGKVYLDLANGYFASDVLPGQENNVRILADTETLQTAPDPRSYGILAFYFEFGNGIVEGLSFHPQEQLFPKVDENGFFAVHQFYGNKFVHGPTPEDFQVSATPNSRTINQGESTTYTITVRSIGFFNRPVSLSVSGLPGGTSFNIVPNPVTPPISATTSAPLSVTTTFSSPPGGFPLTITGTGTTSGGVSLTRAVTVNLIIVEVPADFAISATPTFLELNLTKSGNYTVTITSIGKFNCGVDLTLSGAPSGVTALFTPGTVTPPPFGGSGNAILTVTASSSAKNGTYTLTITGVCPSSGQTHSVNVTLKVLPQPVPPALLIVLLILMALLALLMGLLAALLSQRKRAKPGRWVFVPFKPKPITRFRYIPPRLPRAPIAAVVPFRAMKPPRRATWAFALALASGILIVVNAMLLLSPSFWASLIAVFWWLASLGQPLAFIIGLIIGLTVLMGALVIILGYPVLGGFMILPLAILSLIVGGGFIAGVVLGFLAAILAFVRR